MDKKTNNTNIFDKSSEQEFTWQSKHIKYFLSLKNIGPTTLEKIINLNPDINLWNKNYFELTLSNFNEVKDYLPDSIPSLENLDDEVVISFKDPRYPEAFKNMKKNKPLLLWFKGNLRIEKSIAVVGSRNIIPETGEIVDSFSKNASDNEFTIVSGLAKGVVRDWLEVLKKEDQVVSYNVYLDRYFVYDKFIKRDLNLIKKNI